MAWPGPVLVLIVLVGGQASGLGLVDRDESGDALAIRLALDEGALRARAVEGSPRVDGVALGDAWTTLDVEPTPWRGYPRTVHVALAGPGALVVADNASGLWLRVEPATNATASDTTGPGAPPDGPNDPSSPPAPSSARGEPDVGAGPSSAQAQRSPVPAPLRLAHEGPDDEPSERPYLLPTFLVLVGTIVAVWRRRGRAPPPGPRKG